jgi:hypothetical protein
MLLAAAPPLRADPVSPGLQAAVRDRLGHQILNPFTARWQFEKVRPYAGQTRVVCGHVDFQNGINVYLGPQPFYAVVENDIVKQADIYMGHGDDPGYGLRDKIRLLCGY